MCLVRDPDTQYSIRTSIIWFVTRKKQFTGLDVWERRESSYPYTPQDVSSYVRELFNAHDYCFFQYGCYPIPDGPLLFFPIPAYVKGKKEKIIKAMKEGAKV